MKYPAHPINLWKAQQEAADLMGRRPSEYVIHEERSMFGRYWSCREDICLGINEGYYSPIM